MTPDISHAVRSLLEARLTGIQIDTKCCVYQGPLIIQQPLHTIVLRSALLACRECQNRRQSHDAVNLLRDGVRAHTHVFQVGAAGHQSEVPDRSSVLDVLHAFE